MLGVSAKSHQQHVGADLGVTSFGKDLIRVVLEEKGDDENVLMSPLTIHMLMSMIHLGSPENSGTYKQLVKALHLGSGGQDKMEIYRNILDHYEKISNNKTSGSTLTLTGNIFVKEGLAAKEEYTNLLEKYFSAKFQMFSKKEEAVTLVNNWAKDKTNGLINDILSNEDVKDRTMMILASACYFKSNWMFPFEKSDTQPMKFTLGNQKKVEIKKGMNQEEYLRYAKTNEFEVVELPYENKDLNMYIALPKEKSVAALNKVAAELDLSQFKDDLRKDTIQLKMPSFDATSEIDLKKPLEALGIKDAFADADFSKISDVVDKVDKVKTKTVVKVDEEGSEAAAVAVASVNGIESVDEPSTPVPFIVDRPFVFMIHDKKFDVPLFVGRVVDPK